MTSHHMNVFRLHPQEPEPAPLRRPPEPEPIEEELDFRSLMRIIMVRRWTIMGVIIFAMTVAALVLVQLTPIYSASALVMVGQRENKMLDSDSVLAGIATDTAAIENEMQVLRSTSLADRVVAKLKLAQDPEFKTAGSKRSLLNPLTWFSETTREPKPPKGQASETGLLKKFSSKLSVAAQGRSSVIKITFESASREKAAMIANALADQYTVDQLETKFDAAKQSSGWLNERLNELAAKVRASENAVEQYKTDNGLTDAKGGNTLATEQMSELNSQIVLARSSLAEQEAKYRQVNTLFKQGGSPDSIAAVINSPLISTLRTQQAELVRKEAELGTKYGARHPQMIALQDEKKNLDAKIGEEVKRIIRNLSNEVSVARARLKSLQDSMGEIQGTANDQGRASVRLRELEREAQANRTLYENFQTRFKATEKKEQIQTADARIIQRATIPSDASFPNKPMIMGVTLLGSTILGLLLAFLLERLDNGIRTAAEIERTLHLSNLALVPFLPRTKLVADRIVHKPLSAFSEAIRSIHAGLTLSNVDQPPKVVVITSSMPGEGKTSLAVSLGRLAAKSGQRVVLLDGDLRRPSVGLQFSPRAPEAGLVELLQGRRDLEHVLHRDPISTLEFVPVASAPPNPGDLICSKAMRRLVEVLRHHFDLIIIDAAPVLPVTDTRLLARLADKVIYVVQWDSTPREAVIGGVKLLRDANADLAGVVLNQVDMKKHAIYGYGYAPYGYGKRYARYYAD